LPESVPEEFPFNFFVSQGDRRWHQLVTSVLGGSLVTGTRAIHVRNRLGLIQQATIRLGFVPKKKRTATSKEVHFRNGLPLIYTLYTGELEAGPFTRMEKTAATSHLLSSTLYALPPAPKL
jgi:hypothetical protein